MKMQKSLVFLAIGMLAMFSVTAQAELIPVFDYSFPGAYDGTSTVIYDQSTAGNDGTMQGLGGYEANVRPPGFASGGSIYGGANGCGMTDSAGLLTNALAAAAGGFTFDTWVKLDNTNGGQLVSNCGADALLMGYGKFRASMYEPNAGSTAGEVVYLDGPVPETDRWYHLVYQFDTTGNVLDVNGNLTGELSFIVDGTDVDSATLTRYGAWSSDWLIGVNCKGYTSGNYGSITTGAHLFNPSVSLGIVPEPSALVALAGLLAMLFVRRLIRR